MNKMENLEHFRDLASTLGFKLSALSEMLLAMDPEGDLGKDFFVNTGVLFEGLAKEAKVVYNGLDELTLRMQD